MVTTYSSATYQILLGKGGIEGVLKKIPTEKQKNLVTQAMEEVKTLPYWREILGPELTEGIESLFEDALKEISLERVREELFFIRSLPIPHFLNRSVANPDKYWLYSTMSSSLMESSHYLHNDSIFDQAVEDANHTEDTEEEGEEEKEPGWETGPSGCSTVLQGWSELACLADKPKSQAELSAWASVKMKRWLENACGACKEDS